MLLKKIVSSIHQDIEHLENVKVVLNKQATLESIEEEGLVVLNKGNLYKLV